MYKKQLDWTKSFIIRTLVFNSYLETDSIDLSKIPIIVLRVEIPAVRRKLSNKNRIKPVIDGS